MANSIRIERAAVRAVELYIDECPKLECIISMDDMNPFWDGDIILYRDVNHSISNFMSRIPLIVKGTTDYLQNIYTIHRDYVEAFKSIGGGLFFFVQVTKQERKIFYRIMSVEYSDMLLAQKREKIRIDLKEIPEDQNQFEQELIDYVQKKEDNRDNDGLDSQYIKRLQEDCENISELNISNDIKFKSFKLMLENVKSFKEETDSSILIHNIQEILNNVDSNNDYNINVLSLLTDFASFLKVQRKNDIAEQYYYKALQFALKLINDTNGKYKTNEVMDYLISPFKYTNDFEAIEKTCLNLIENILKSCEKDPVNFVEPLTNIYLYFADFYEENNKHRKAEINYYNSLNLYYSLSASNNDKYIKDTITVLWKIYEIHKKIRHYHKAKLDIDDALFYNKIELIDKAKLLEESAFLLKKHKDSTKAEVNYLESLKIYRELGDLFGIARITASLAELSIEPNKEINDNYTFKKSIEQYNKLENDNSEILASKANTLCKYANMYIKKGNKSKAEKRIKEALELQEYISDSDKYLPDYIETLITMCRLNPSGEELVKYFSQAIKFLYKLAKTDPEGSISIINHIMNYSRGVNSNICNFKEKDYIYNLEKELFDIIMKNYKELEEELQNYYKEDFTFILNHLADFYKAFKKNKEAEIIYKKLLDERLEIAKSNPKFLKYVGFTFHELGRLYFKEPDLNVDPKPYYLDALNILNQLYNDGDNQYLEELANLHYDLGNLARKDKNKEAEDEFKKALSYYEKYNKKNLVKIAQTYENIADILKNDASRIEEAIDATNLAIQYYSNNSKYIDKKYQLYNSLDNLIDSRLKPNGSVDEVAFNAVKEFIDKCPKLNCSIINNGRKTIEGMIYAYDHVENNKELSLFCVSIQVKGTIDTNNSYEISRYYLKKYKIDKGCVFFLVQVNSEQPHMLYNILTTEDINKLLRKRVKTIKINMNKMPNPIEFEKELFAFDANRDYKKADYLIPHETGSLVDDFEKIRDFLEEIEDKESRDELESCLDVIINSKDDDSIGWRDKFIYYASRALDLAINNLKNHDFVILLFNLGKYLYNQKQYHLVGKYCEKALDIYRGLAENAPDTYNGNVANTLEILGELYQVLTRYEEAEQKIQEALKIRRELSKKNTDVNIRDFASTLIIWGNLHRVLTRYEEAEQQIQEALKICRELAKNNKDTNNPDVATALYNLAILHDDLNRKEEAGQEYSESLDIRRELARIDPDTYIGAVAMTLDKLGELHRVLAHYKKAEEELLEALEIRRKLSETNRNAYVEDVATTLNNLGKLYRDLTRYEEAEQEFQEALEIRRELAKKNPEAYIDEVATTLNNLGKLYRYLNRYEEAEQKYQQALEILRGLDKPHRDTFKRKLIRTLNDLASLHSTIYQYEEAKQEYQDALEKLQELDNPNREAYIGDEAMIHNNLGELHRDLSCYNLAEQEFQKSLEIRRDLAKINRNTYIKDVAMTLYNLAHLLRKNKDRLEDARKMATESMKIYKELAETNPQIWGRYVENTQQLLKVISK